MKIKTIHTNSIIYYHQLLYQPQNYFYRLECMFIQGKDAIQEYIIIFWHDALIIYEQWKYFVD